MYDVYFADLESQKGIITYDNSQQAVIFLNKNLPINEVPIIVKTMLRDLQEYLIKNSNKEL